MVSPGVAESLNSATDPASIEASKRLTRDPRNPSTRSSCAPGDLKLCESFGFRIRSFLEGNSNE